MADTGGPWVGRLRGQQLARQELARSIYRPSLLERIWRDISRWLGSLHSTSRAGSLSSWGLVLLAVAVAAAVAAVLYWLGPTKVNRRGSDRSVLDVAPRSARSHREAAEQFAASENYGAAIIERVRAIVVDLETRDVLVRRAARTAMEFATEAGASFPTDAGALVRAAHRFDDVRYGGRTGTEPDYRAIQDLDVRIAATPPTPPDSPAAATTRPLLPSAQIAGSDHPSGLS